MKISKEQQNKAVILGSTWGPSLGQDVSGYIFVSGVSVWYITPLFLGSSISARNCSLHLGKR